MEKRHFAKLLMLRTGAAGQLPIILKAEIFKLSFRFLVYIIPKNELWFCIITIISSIILHSTIES